MTVGLLGRRTAPPSAPVVERARAGVELGAQLG